MEIDSRFKNFVEASTANYCNSRIYPIYGSQVGLTNVLSLWVNAYHLLILFSYACWFSAVSSLCTWITTYIMCVLGKLWGPWTHKVHPLWPHQVYQRWPQSVNNSPTVAIMNSLFSKWTHHEVTMHKVQEAIMYRSNCGSPSTGPVPLSRMTLTWYSFTVNQHFLTPHSLPIMRLTGTP